MATWSQNSYQFRALFSNDAGGAVTKAVILTVVSGS
jgi:hypothetical protein